MKISTTSVKGVKDHTYTVNAYEGGYGQGAVRKVSVSALDTHVTNGGTTTYIDPTGLDKVGGSYTWENKKDDLGIGGDGYATASGYNSPSHKVAFDVITGKDTTITEAARPGVEAGYHGESWSCVDDRDQLPVATNGAAAYINNSSASSGVVIDKTIATIGESVTITMSATAPTTDYPIAATTGNDRCRMYNNETEEWTYFAANDFVRSGSYGPLTLTISNVTGPIRLRGTTNSIPG